MTEYVIRERQAGKTTDLLKRMDADERIVMVCISRAAAQAAHRTGESLGMLIDRARFVTPSEVNNRPPAQGRNGEEPRYVVDNAELVLARMLGGSIVALSATGTPVPDEQP